MKRTISSAMAVMGILGLICAGEALAAGRGGGRQGGTCIRGTAGAGGSTTARPAGSQRRDGTFLTTGTTANGSTTRPGYGNGAQDGSRLSATTPVTK